MNREFVSCNLEKIGLYEAKLSANELLYVPFFTKLHSHPFDLINPFPV